MESTTKSANKFNKNIDFRYNNEHNKITKMTPKIIFDIKTIYTNYMSMSSIIPGTDSCCRCTKRTSRTKDKRIYIENRD